MQSCNNFCPRSLLFPPTSPLFSYSSGESSTLSSSSSSIHTAPPIFLSRSLPSCPTRRSIMPLFPLPPISFSLCYLFFFLPSPSIPPSSRPRITTPLHHSIVPYLYLRISPLFRHYRFFKLPLRLTFHPNPVRSKLFPL